VLDGLHQADVAFLDEVIEARAPMGKLLGHRHHEGEIGQSQGVAG
jgi:hypothetical protein